MENDSDFDNADSSDSENVIDSDFDIDENQDLAAQDDVEVTEKALQTEERETRRKKPVYKDPKARNAKQKVLTKKKSTLASSSLTVVESTSESTSTPTTGRPGRKRALPSTSKSAGVAKRYRSDDGGLFEDDEEASSTISRSLRKSTQKSSKEIRDLLDERKRTKLKNKKRFKKNENRVLTQSELLREAKKTDMENARSLEACKHLELEKIKKVKPSTKMPKVPMIRYHSYTEFEYDGGDEEVADNDDKTNEEEETKENVSLNCCDFVLKLFWLFYRSPM